MIVTDSLTHSSKLEIGNFSCLTPPLGQSGDQTLVSLKALEGLVNLVIPVSHISLVNPVSLVTICLFV